MRLIKKLNLRVLLHLTSMKGLKELRWIHLCYFDARIVQFSVGSFHMQLTAVHLVDAHLCSTRKEDNMENSTTIQSYWCLSTWVIWCRLDGDVRSQMVYLLSNSSLLHSCFDDICGAASYLRPAYVRSSFCSVFGYHSFQWIQTTFWILANSSSVVIEMPIWKEAIVAHDSMLIDCLLPHSASQPHESACMVFL